MRLKFEEFISELRKFNWGIVAMNEYSIKKVTYIYIVVKERGTPLARCIKQAGPDYEKVFDSIIGELGLLA